MGDINMFLEGESGRKTKWRHRGNISTLFDLGSDDRFQGGKLKIVTGKQWDKSTIPWKAFPGKQIMIFILKNAYHLTSETVKVTTEYKAEKHTDSFLGAFLFAF